MWLFGKRYIRFTENGGTFCLKRRYVFARKDRRFAKNGGTFLQERIDIFITTYISDSY